MANAPIRKSAKPEASDKPAKPERTETPFINDPSTLDEKTHEELRLMHQESAAAILFAKTIQWRSVAGTLMMFGALIAVAIFTSADKKFIDLLSILSIVLVCGVVFVLTMYQFWQLNEINKIEAIEKHFSTLYARISRKKSRREGNFHRYTLLLFMLAVVILGAIVVNAAIHGLPIPVPKY